MGLILSESKTHIAVQVSWSTLAPSYTLYTNLFHELEVSSLAAISQLVNSSVVLAVTNPETDQTVNQ